jgi:integrase
MGLNYSDYLLTAYNPQTEEFRPISENALVKRVYNLFTKYKNKHVTINTLRHSYISYKTKNDQHLKEKRMVAKHMMHSTSMAETYRRSVYQK